MKICIIAPSVIPILGKKQGYGGIELIVGLATEELVRRGHDVYLFASGESETSAHLIPTVPKAVGQGISFELEKTYNRLAYELAVSLRPDIIWDHTLALHAQKMVKRIPGPNFTVHMRIVMKDLVDTKGIPVVHTLHGPGREHLKDMTKRLAKSGHYFVTISHDQAKKYFPFIRKQHLGTVYNTVDTDFYKIGKKQSNFLLWVGRYAFEKGPHIALHAAHKIGMPLKLVGKLAEKHEYDYFNTFIKDELQEEDEIFTSISPQQKAKLFRTAYATLMTTLWDEPFGIVSIESMASGTPVIAPNKGALPEILGKVGVIVPVEDLVLHEDLGEMTPDQRIYIDRVVDAIPQVQRLKQTNVRQRVENLFSIKQNVDGYEEAFAKAIYFKKAKI